jgi:hypothetical protein
MKTTSVQSALSVEYKIDFSSGDKNQKVSKTPPRPGKRTEELPHITRLLALAYHLQSLIDRGIVRDYADIARLSSLSRARLSQIMNLVLLAPQIQEEILCSGSFPEKTKEQDLRAVLKSPVWKEQIRFWEKLKQA